ncbi:multi-sensor signal transduction histidine kinase [Phaffia rhodozyma]|uniref:Multi-sensor signal transduction histidine kinase n=1 Tax=Phaffia rhodozyma TaxID=264483 RepID=A0A0F7SS39_PHARH|nr:multi-sensor signal transduction histidine kinase [Phaffia rhodozyma]
MSTVEGDVDPAASNMFYPDFSNLTLLPYLACHPHPSFVLPSPRPSLVSLWTNPAASAASLGKDLETILSPLDQARMKSLILAHDQDLDGVISADKDHTTNQAMADAISIPSVRAPSSIESYNSFQDGNNSMDGNEMDITVRLPLWGRKRSYKVLLVSSSHPSFLILHLHPISRPNSHKPKPKANENHSSSVNPVAWEDLQQLTGDEITSRIEVGQGYSSDGNDAHTPMAEEHHKLLTESSILMDSWLAQDAQVPAPPTLVINEKSKKKLEEFDWANHPLGPRDKWPVPLVTTVNMLLSITDSSYIWWSYGDDWIIINNDAYGQDLNENHFGSFASVAWADEVQTGVSKSDDTFFLNGMEKHLTWKWTPIVSGDGECHGIMVTTHDSTGKVLNERWQQTSREIVRRLTPARTISEFCGSLMKSLEINERDFPYAFLYQLRSETASGEKTDISVEANLTLAGSVGIPLDHPVLPRSTFIKTSLDKNSENRDLTPWKFKEAIEAAFHSDEPISLPDVHVNIPEEIRYRSYGDETKQAVIMKIANNEERRGKIFFLVIGLNTRRPLDSAYKARIDDLRLQLISNLTIITSFESHMDRELQLQSIEKAKSLFFSSVSHELRTPLQLISGPISDLEAGESDPKKKASFSMIQRNSTRLARLVDSLMDFSRIEGGRMSGRFIPINFSLTTIELSEMFRSAIERARITYVVDCEVESGARPVYVDKELYEKIVFNILGNAFKYTLRGSITVRVSHHPSEVELCVTDTGVGIPKQDLPRVTERFFRVTCTARSHEGTGMGLALCSDLVHLHSGRLQIDSETEEESPTGESGTTVSVFLPYGKSHLPASQTSEEIDSSINLSSTYSKWIVDEAVRWSNSRNGTSASVSESGLSASESSGRADSLYWNKSSDLVLIVDDSSDMRQYMNQIFSSFCKVITARDGEEALALARSAKPNLILSDISMPKLDGYGLLRALRKENPDEDDIDLALIPVILISARAGDEERVSGLLAGAEDYLSKPFSAKELIARAHLQLQLGKSRLELERNFREQSAATKLLSDASPVGISRWNADGEIM